MNRLHLRLKTRENKMFLSFVVALSDIKNERV